jgi:hypothetical protein
VEIRHRITRCRRLAEENDAAGALRFFHRNPERRRRRDPSAREKKASEGRVDGEVSLPFVLTNLEQVRRREKTGEPQDDLQQKK